LVNRPAADNRIFVRFYLDKNNCSIYNSIEQKFHKEVTAMTTFGFVMILLGAGSVSASLMHLFERLDQPRPRRHAA
jgi:hypothetical protein